MGQPIHGRSLWEMTEILALVEEDIYGKRIPLESHEPLSGFSDVSHPPVEQDPILNRIRELYRIRVFIPAVTREQSPLENCRLRASWTSETVSHEHMASH